MSLPQKSQLSLVVLAAGVGSRFGGIKQLSSVGPAEETIVDYSIYDAQLTGFNRVIFIIRPEIEADFRRLVGAFWEKIIEISYAFQELHSALPANWSPPAGRQKPWGTGHALLMVEPIVTGPFAVINADDFYGRQAFELVAACLKQKFIELLPPEDNPRPKYVLAGYRLENTLSPFGPVCRGLCRLDGRIINDIKEIKHIEKAGDKVRARQEDGAWAELSGKEVVSMNFWGFEPSIFAFLHQGFDQFLQNHGRDHRAEFLIPDLVGELIRSGKARVHYLPTEEKWFGITYPQDLPGVRRGIAELVARGVYPPNLKASLANK